MTDDIFNYDDIYDPMANLDISGGFDFNALANGLSLVGTVGKALGTLEQGREMAKADEYNADLVRQQGVMEQYQIGEAETSLLSTQRAIYARSGVTMSGSPLDTALRTGTQYELTKQISKYNTESKANMLEWQGKMAKQKSEFSAGLGLLEGGAELALALA